MSSGDRERFSNVTAAANCSKHTTTTSYNKSRRCTIYALVAQYNGSHKQWRLAVAAPTRRSWREVSTYYFILLNGFGPDAKHRRELETRAGHILFYPSGARCGPTNDAASVSHTISKLLQTIYIIRLQHPTSVLRN